MYLSRLILNPANRQAQYDAAFPYELHRSVMQGFPGKIDTGEERVLFRLESQPAHGGLMLLVQSQGQPDWRPLIQRQGGGLPYILPISECTGGLAANPETKPFSLQLEPGRCLSFRLLANPTVKKIFRPEGERQNKRIGIYQEQEQIEWLNHKAEVGGFRVLRAVTSRQDLANRGRLERDGKHHQLKMLGVQFDGILEVADPDLLGETVQHGIGSGKGLGFGMLSLAPAPAGYSP
jgi:CRISPR system Cascade subunit CasE